MEKKTKYQKQLKGNSGGGRGGGGSGINGGQNKQKSDKITTRRYNPIDRLKQREDGDIIDLKFGFNRYIEGSPRLGWLLNYLPMVNFIYFIFILYLFHFLYFLLLIIVLVLVLVLGLDYS